MIKLTDKLWIGNSQDGAYTDFDLSKVKAVFNVANDLNTFRYTWQDAEYAKVGLIDGPGNETTFYCGALLTLAGLVARHSAVMVYDHDGARALVVCMMYINLEAGKYRPDHVGWSHWMTWEERLATIDEATRNRLPKPHKAHVEVFNKLPFGVLEVLL